MQLSVPQKPLTVNDASWGSHRDGFFDNDHCLALPPIWQWFWRKYGWTLRNEFYLLFQEPDAVLSPSTWRKHGALVLLQGSSCNINSNLKLTDREDKQGCSLKLGTLVQVSSSSQWTDSKVFFCQVKSFKNYGSTWASILWKPSTKSM